MTSKPTARSVPMTHSITTRLNSERLAEERLLRMLHSGRLRISKRRRAWWFSSTDLSLYSRARGAQVVVRKVLVVAGWSMSCARAAISAASNSVSESALLNFVTKKFIAWATSAAWQELWKGCEWYDTSMAVRRAWSLSTWRLSRDIKPWVLIKYIPRVSTGCPWQAALSSAASKAQNVDCASASRSAGFSSRESSGPPRGVRSDGASRWPRDGGRGLGDFTSLGLSSVVVQVTPGGPLTFSDRQGSPGASSMETMPVNRPSLNSQARVSPSTCEDVARFSSFGACSSLESSMLSRTSCSSCRKGATSTQGSHLARCR
mmetsp:Transcript_6367/g.14686  ORF Transcript_6367/g.14686 Transcript_6367/m.14686 type:complete len:318 (+) Transcript_6367:1504-2457(+)